MSVSEKALLNACRVLFGPELRINSDFLAYLQLSGVKSAFRQRAKETHPDHQSISCRETVVDSSQFTQVHEAYTALEEYICRRESETRPLSSSVSQRSSCTAEDVSSTCGYRSFREKHQREFVYSFKVMPSRRLKFGRYLFHAGAVQWQDVINALVWQRASRPRMGELAKMQGILRDEDIRWICCNRFKGMRFGEQACQLGMLTEEQVRSLVLIQKLQQQKIGRYFVVKQMMAQHELYAHIRECHMHNSRYPVSS